MGLRSGWRVRRVRNWEVRRVSRSFISRSCPEEPAPRSPVFPRPDANVRAGHGRVRHSRAATTVWSWRSRAQGRRIEAVSGLKRPQRHDDVRGMRTWSRALPSSRRCKCVAGAPLYRGCVSPRATSRALPGPRNLQAARRNSRQKLKSRVRGRGMGPPEKRVRRPGPGSGTARPGPRPGSPRTGSSRSRRPVPPPGAGARRPCPEAARKAPPPGTPAGRVRGG